jgi:hypothetical protein
VPRRRIFAVTPDEIEAALKRADEALAAGRSLKGTGFWRAVDAVRRDRSLADRYADRMASIDRRAFERGVKLRVPLALGLIWLVGATAVGIAAVIVARRWNLGIVFLVGFGALLIGTHSLAHWVAGRVVGIRFTHVFLGGPPPPRPGLKTDYATYLRATRKQRAMMHASGAVVTKIVPFALIPFSPLTWVCVVLIAIGGLQIVTDIVLSTKVSDWKKVKRELS